jgi:hypothetical protein
LGKNAGGIALICAEDFVYKICGYLRHGAAMARSLAKLPLQLLQTKGGFTFGQECPLYAAQRSVRVFFKAIFRSGVQQSQVRFFQKKKDNK